MSGSNPHIKCAVIGDPVSHSLSPVIHNHWFEAHNIKGTYEAITVERGALKPAVSDMVDAGYRGLNVTIPHKESIIELCDTLDDAAQKIGAVNMVEIKDNVLHGYNTDAMGFAAHFEKTIQDQNRLVRRDKALVFGAGGAARAIIYALFDLGYQDVLVANRTFERAKNVTQALGGKPVEWRDINTHIDGAATIINTSSLGMDGQPPLEIDISSAPEDCVISDIVYKPLKTELLKSARARGLLCVDGLGMLLHQAVPAFEAWTGVRPQADDILRGKIESKLS